MNASAAGPLLGTGLLLGIAGDVRLRAEGAPGLGMFVWTACVAIATLVLYRRGGVSPSSEATTLVAIATALMSTRPGAQLASPGAAPGRGSRRRARRTRQTAAGPAPFA